MDHDTRHLDGKETPYEYQFDAEDLDIFFSVPINIENFPHFTHSQVYAKQREIISYLCDADEGEKIRRVLPVSLDAEGVEFVTRYSVAMHDNLPTLMKALDIISGVHVDYSLCVTNEEHQFADVVPIEGESYAFRLATEDELIEMYGDCIEDPAGVEFYTDYPYEAYGAY